MSNQSVTLPIYGLGCGGSGVHVVERVLTRVPGVAHVYVNPATEMAYISYDPAVSTREQLRAIIDDAGYGPLPVQQHLRLGKGKEIIQMRPQPVSAMVFAVCGVILMGMGLYFMLLRPPLLPEDLRAIGASVEQVQAMAPGLQTWLRRVFWVMGGYIFTVGLLTSYIAGTAVRVRTPGASGVIAVAGATSIGWMTVVNFLIASDFRWLLLGFALLWVVAWVLVRKDVLEAQRLGSSDGSLVEP
jgi:cation transport ATPase